MKRIELENGDHLLWEYTPWDEAVFLKKTAQLVDFKCQSEDSGRKLLAQFESDSGAEFVYGRFISSDFAIKKIFFDLDYFVAETSLQVYLSGLQNYELSGMYKKRLQTLSYISNDRLDDVATIAHEMFNFSRFHEDPHITNEKANLRIKSWVLDMKNQDVKTLISKDADDNIRGFMIYEIENHKTAKLVLGGCIASERASAPFFWATVIDELKNAGFSKIRTTISAANSGVLSLYLNLGFGISVTHSDYHKHL